MTVWDTALTGEKLNKVNIDIHHTKARRERREVKGGDGRCWGWYLHSHAIVHHGHAGVPMPAHVHHGVTTVRRLALQRRPRGTQVVLRLRLQGGVLKKFWEIQDAVIVRQNN